MPKISEVNAPRPFVVEVTIKQTYVFGVKCAAQFESPKHLVRSWFHDSDINSRHASRDGALVGNSAILVKAEVLPPGKPLLGGKPVICTSLRAVKAVSGLVSQTRKKSRKNGS